MNGNITPADSKYDQDSFLYGLLNHITKNSCFNVFERKRSGCNF